jgi:hypothetical protein
MNAGDFDLLTGAYSSGHCPGFSPGSLLSPVLRLKQERLQLCKYTSLSKPSMGVKKKYSPFYERNFYTFIPSKK